MAHMALNDASKPFGFMSVADLRAFIASGAWSRVLHGEIETVMVQLIDLYGRPMGKLFDGHFFLEDCMGHGTHACNYLMTVDMPMNVVAGFDGYGWRGGYGDVLCVPDLRTLRYCAWREKTALVQCDLFAQDGMTRIEVSPRNVLRRQCEALSAPGRGLARANVASELEYFMFRETYRGAHGKGHANLEPFGAYVEDYHLLQGGRSEFYHSKCRRFLRESGVRVETTKGEAACGQHELNIRYNEALAMADDHILLKQCLKEVADAAGIAVTFMAKPNAGEPGSSCHIHCSLADGAGANAFVGDRTLGRVRGVSRTFEHFLAGWMRYVPDLMPMYAPTINSYKRFQSLSWAPTALVWSLDNRTAGFRIVGSGTRNVRIEMRIPGADANPYLAFAAALASGLKGLRDELEPPPEFLGDAYQGGGDLPKVPLTLKDAVAAFEASPFAREAFGPAVVHHYTRFFTNEIEQFDRAVTDWERRRYFEQI